MAIASDEVAAMFGDKDSPKGGNVATCLVFSGGESKCFTVTFLFCFRPSKKIFQKSRQLATKKLEKVTPSIAGRL